MPCDPKLQSHDVLFLFCSIGLLPLRRTTCRSSSSGSYIMSTLRLRSPYTNRFQWSSCSRNHLTKLLKLVLLNLHLILNVNNHVIGMPVPVPSQGNPGKDVMDCFSSVGKGTQLSSSTHLARTYTVCGYR